MRDLASTVVLGLATLLVARCGRASSPQPASARSCTPALIVLEPDARLHLSYKVFAGRLFAAGCRVDLYKAASEARKAAAQELVKGAEADPLSIRTCERAGGTPPRDQLEAARKHVAAISDWCWEVRSTETY